MSLLFSLDPFHIILPIPQIPYVLAVQLTRIIRQTAAVSLATNKSIRASQSVEAKHQLSRGKAEVIPSINM